MVVELKKDYALIALVICCTLFWPVVLFTNSIETKIFCPATNAPYFAAYAAVATSGDALAAAKVVMIRSCDLTKLIPADNGGVARNTHVVPAGIAPDTTSEMTPPATVAVSAPMFTVNTFPGAGADTIAA